MDDRPRKNSASTTRSPDRHRLCSARLERGPRLIAGAPACSLRADGPPRERATVRGLHSLHSAAVGSPCNGTRSRNSIFSRLAARGRKRRKKGFTAPHNLDESSGQPPAIRQPGPGVCDVSLRPTAESWASLAHPIRRSSSFRGPSRAGHRRPPTEALRYLLPHLKAHWGPCIPDSERVRPPSNLPSRSA
jgi:hypothetical protein